MDSISVNYRLKWQVKDNPNYRWSECGKLFNIKSGRVLKKTLNGYSKGYWIGKKFITLSNLRKQLVKIEHVYCPF